MDLITSFIILALFGLIISCTCSILCCKVSPVMLNNDVMEDSSSFVMCRPIRITSIQMTRNGDDHDVSSAEDVEDSAHHEVLNVIVDVHQV